MLSGRNLAKIRSILLLPSSGFLEARGSSKILCVCIYIIRDVIFNNTAIFKVTALSVSNIAIAKA
jgi:hypothetical protein